MFSSPGPRFVEDGDERIGDAKYDNFTDDYEDFFAHHYPRLLSYIRRRVEDSHTAEDICTECFLLAWKSLGSDCGGSPGWLYAAAKNLIGMEYRRQMRERRLLSKLAELEQGSDSDSDDAQIAIAVTCLEPDDRAALSLTYWLGLTASEAAKVSGCSERAMWKRISRARSQLQRILTSLAYLI